MTEQPGSNRRDFLRGEAARKAVEHFADGFRHELPREGLPDASSAPAVLMHYGRDAMAVEFQVFLPAAVANEAGAVALESLELLEPLEQQMTIYRESSEVCAINRRASHEAVSVEENLFALFQQAIDFSRATGGAYDMTSGPLTKLWGFYRRQGRMPSDEEIADVMLKVGYQKLLLDPQAFTIRFLSDGMELNLGGIGKGYALDCLGHFMRTGDVPHFLLHGGQSSVLAHGSRNNDGKDEGWRIGITHPLRPNLRLAEIVLRDQALGTSGSGSQFFHHQGKRYGHILDPRTGHPADALLSATVVAPTAAAADALSTAFYVGGTGLAQSYCQAHPEISALLSQATASGQLELIPVNLPAQRWQRLD